MDIFYALAEPTRRDIVELLARQGQLPASDIYQQFPVSHPAISQHLKVLREAKIVNVQKRAQQRIYGINPDAFDELQTWVNNMAKLWNRRLNAFDKVLAQEKKKLHNN